MKLAYRYGGSTGPEFELEASPDLVVVRTHRRAPLRTTPLEPRSTVVVGRMQPVLAFANAGVQVLRADEVDQQEALKTLKAEPKLRFAGTGLRDARSKEPVLYTENVFVKFRDSLDAASCEKTLRDHGLKPRRALGYARNSYFASAPEGTGRHTFEIVAELLAVETVELCHPELIREMSFRGAFPQQWHLQQAIVGGTSVNAHANVVSAWAASQGEGIVIALIDDGVDVGHPEFASPGKIVAPRNATTGSADPRPGSGDEQDNHGTACAGVACADGLHGAAGVAPKAKLMPIRLVSGLGSQAEADAFVWAAEHGADVISCSWGPVDGRWWDPSDPRHAQVVALPDHTRLAIDFATASGRGGKGCVITWAAGNGNEPVENDGYASYERVISVAACNDKGRRSAYSDQGRANHCCFPSNDGVASLTPGIWTTDRRGSAGYNAGSADQGDAAGDYTNDFGGTSSACPGAAGVAALVLARNPSLRWDELKEIFKTTSDKIDQASGGYDAGGHSPDYGYGRLNAAGAVAAAVPAPAPAASSYRVTHTIEKEVAIRDFQRAEIELEVPESAPIAALRVHVDVEHSYIGDLTIHVVPPGQGAEPVLLHDTAGGGTHNIKRFYDALTTPELAALHQQSPKGRWKLLVEDQQAQDTGVIRGFGIELTF